MSIKLSIKLLFDLHLHYLHLLYNDDGESYFLNCPEWSYEFEKIISPYL